MNELSDNEFDRLLKHKAEAFDYDFDESAWQKMEGKLRRRDRIIFIRNTSVVLLLLMLFGGSYFMLRKDEIKGTNQNAAKEKKITPATEPSVDTPQKADLNTVRLTAKKSYAIKNSNQEFKTSPSKPVELKGLLANKKASIGLPEEKKYNTSPNSFTPETPKDSQTLVSTSLPPVGIISTADTVANLLANIPTDTSGISKVVAIKKHTGITFGFTAQAGPEFSSVKSVGGKGNVNLGLLLNASYKKLTLSSGLRYGVKSYAPSAGDYALQNPSRAPYITTIDASCNILEIPLLASYNLVNDKRKKIAFTTGLSSYLMLKEQYNFKYAPEKGWKDYNLVKNNANQHYFSVLNLSASYQLKLTKGFQWAIEPYLKLPLGGVGEGKVRLKSSGMSFNLIYDIRKKNNLK